VVLAVTLAVAAGWFDSLNVVHGAPLWVPVGVAAACLLASTASRTSRWWRTWGAGLAAATTIVVAVAHWWIRHSGLVLDKYPDRFVIFAWLAVAAVGIGVTGWWGGPAALRVVRVLAAPTSVLAAFLLINSYYGYWPTVASVLKKPVAGQMSKRAFARLLVPAQAAPQATPGALVAANRGMRSGVPAPPASASSARATPTSPTTALPARGAPTVPRLPPGQYGPVDIPGTAVGFAAAQAYLWLPPDFATVPHANLSAMVMLPGWPGNVQDWTRAGGVTDIANAWARAHGGHAPVMVFIDQNGAAGHDTECVDSIEGRAESYLVGSVPLFLAQALGITPDPSRWALVGYSEGGTCALTLALRHPGIYGRLVDIAGDSAPNYWGGPAATLRTLYAGNITAQALHTPSSLLQQHRYPGMVAWFATSNSDILRAANAQLAARAARAGIEVQTLNSPGGHTWTYARQAFARMYPGLVGYLTAGAAATPTT
jgi:S-formylglutathione hydrolase FrmB